MPGELSPLRPPLQRRGTDAILSYYQSNEAGTSYHPDNDDYVLRSISRHSSSSSLYSSPGTNSRTADVSTNEYRASPVSRDVSSGRSVGSTNYSTPSTESHRRRPSARSVGGSDKRRVVIMETDDAQLTSDNQNAPHERSPDQIPSLLAKRGVNSSMLGGLALVAPPDASPSVYTNLSPPMSAPPLKHKYSAGPDGRLYELEKKHQRSMSEAANQGTHALGRKTSRDVGIVGAKSLTPSSANSDQHTAVSASQTLRPTNSLKRDDLRPIFQTPQSRTPSPLSGASTSTDEEFSSNRLTASRPEMQRLLTPTLGRPKSVNEPVIGPVVVGLNANQYWQPDSSSPLTVVSDIESLDSTNPASPGGYSQTASALSSPYLHYQPGLHATAGPLPPPPRHIPAMTTNSPPPPRPPRLHSPSPNRRARMQADTHPNSLIQAESSPEASLDAMSSVFHTTSLNLQQSPAPSSSSQELPMKHAREGAFPASSIFLDHTRAQPQGLAEPPSEIRNPASTMDDLVAAVGNAIDQVGLVDARDVAPASVIEPSRDQSPSKYELVLQRRNSKRSSGGRSGSSSCYSSPVQPASPENHLAEAVNQDGKEIIQQSIGDHRSQIPSQSSVTYIDSKRFSALPRTPSITSTTYSSPPSSRRSLDTLSVQPLEWKHKIKSQWPDAMRSNDILRTKSVLERGLSYARKINELAMYDCGLEEWVTWMKKGPGNNRYSLYALPHTSLPENRPPGREIKSRHASRGSISSQATFPRRADTYLATDLAAGPTIDDGTPLDAVPSSLPYPQLAQAMRGSSNRTFGILSTPSIRSGPSALVNTTKSLRGNFFSSIGRKTSLKKDRLLSPTISSSNNVLTRSAASTASRLVKVNTTPLIPGGPRAIPNRIQRAQSVIANSPLNSPVHRTPLQISQPIPTEYVQTSLPQLHSPSETPTSRRLSLKRRSTLTTPTAAPPLPVREEPFVEPGFEKQVSKLADLLPHADRTVLAGYLRRAGQDILAIGQYLEDERQGTIRYD